MIPLIDVSLVLLIFFMMTAGAAVATSGIDTPPAESGYVTSDPAVVCISIGWRPSVTSTARREMDAPRSAGSASAAATRGVIAARRARALRAVSPRAGMADAVRTRSAST